MGTEKRQRKKQGHQARMEAARAAALREQRKRRAIRFGAAAVAIVAVLFAISWMGGDDDDADVASDDTTPTTEAGATTSTTLDITKPEVTVPDGPPPEELQTEDLVVGDGEEAKAGDEVEVHYVGVRHEDGEEFDASWNSGNTFRFTLGEGRVIQGWDQGVVGMRVGGRRQLVIPGDLAYGDDAPAGYPAGTLVFVVDLVSIA
jgi:peptidylprolyl isomerase